jgi:hypothetical protein
MRFNGTTFIGLWAMRVLLGLGLFAAAASERMLLLAGLILCIAASLPGRSGECASAGGALDG